MGKATKEFMKKELFYFVSVLCLIFITLPSCTPHNPIDENQEEQEEQIEKPEVSLKNYWGRATDSTATLYARIIDNGNDDEIVYGFIVYPHYEEIRYNESEEIKVYCTDGVDAEGVFSCTIEGLISGSLYEYKAFAQNKLGYVESGTSTFKTKGPTIKVCKDTEAYEEDIQLYAYVSSNQGLLGKWGICWGETPQPTYESNQQITWTDRTYSYYHLDGLKKGTTYYVRAFAFVDNKCRYGAQISFTTLSNWTSCAPAGEMVDLGLSVKWADRYVGAYNSTSKGESFSFGETKAKASYGLKSYKFWPAGSSDNLLNYTPTKYNNIDGLTTLLPEDDAAIAIWGNGWRMPTYGEVLELVKNCEIIETTNNGIEGWLFTSKINGNYIFFANEFDFEDCFYCWSSTLSTENYRDSWALYGDDYYGTFPKDCDRYCGHFIRPVHE